MQRQIQNRLESGDASGSVRGMGDTTTEWTPDAMIVDSGLLCSGLLLNENVKMWGRSFILPQMSFVQVASLRMCGVDCKLVLWFLRGLQTQRDVIFLP
mmetsp:Transcript_24373/g.29544  ORF Transcript_24373/g.29544 Transcript_24373/m.29544 type:complete len:98 (+) Transcript_24373:90-383(+)